MDKLRRALTFFAAAALAFTCYLGMCATVKASDGSLSFDDLLNASRSPTEITVSADKSVVTPGEEITVTVSVTGGERMYTTFAYAPVWDNAGYEIVNAEIVGVGLDAPTSAVQMGNRVYVMYDTAQARTGEMFRFTVKIKEDAVLGEYPVTAAILVAKKSISYDYVLHDLTLCIQEAACDEGVHVLGDWVVETDPTCTEDGEKRQYCNLCDYYKSGIIEATGHDHKPVVTDPTCTEQGYTTHSCACGDSYADTYVKALEHSFTNYISNNDATYGADGTKTAVCDRDGCNASDTVTEEGSKLQKNGWFFEGNKWYYYKSDVEQTGWLELNSTWYYMNSRGEMQTGWQSVGNVWYYFKTSGAMVKGWQLLGGTYYYFNSSGAMVTGWKEISKTWYYFKSSGAMVTGTAIADGTLCKFDASGAWKGYLTGWQKVNGKWYYGGTNGKLTTGWKAISGVYYYFNNAGVMQTGWIKDGGVYYYMNSSGAMVTGWQKVNGTWYYFRSSGAMVTGWLKLGGVWYYFRSSGAMVTGSLNIGGKVYNFNSSGVCLNP